jgi:hypothetical protein
MSLIVAQMTNDGPRIVSDTWISFPYDAKLNYKKGILKTVIITPEITICFAGNVKVGLGAMRQFANGIRAGQPIDDLIPDLLGSESDHERYTEFIIANTKADSKLIRIRGQKIERELESAWIGDQNGFERFQEERNRLLDNLSLTLSQESDGSKMLMVMHDAMKAVIDDTAIESVNGFCVRARAKEGKFNYLPSTFLHVGRDFQITPGDDLISKMAQTVAEGGYSFSIVEPIDSGIPALGVNFPRAQIGMVYLPLEFDEVQVINNVSPRDFSKAVFERFGIVMSDPLLR